MISGLEMEALAVAPGWLLTPFRCAVLCGYLTQLTFVTRTFFVIAGFISVCAAPYLQALSDVVQ